MPDRAQSQDVDKNLEAVKGYLKEKYPAKKWQYGPKQLASTEITKAYGDRDSFYFVHSSPPLPPGAPLPELIKAYQEKVQDYQKNYISAVVRIDAEGKIHPLPAAALKTGLMAVKTEEDARIAAAAVLSLTGDGRTAPGPVQAKEVQVTRKGEGWSCQVTRQNNFQGTVEFDAKGQLTKVTKVSIAPLPP